MGKIKVQLSKIKTLYFVAISGESCLAWHMNTS
jgi:hypothetical protein